MNCRFCSTPLRTRFLDLGYAPPSNAYLKEEDLVKPEKAFPLRLYVCENCLLVQTEDYSRSEELFSNDYAYFSSVSSFFLSHAKAYCDMITPRLGLTQNNFVLEIASNDGYLLRNFVEQGIPCLGIEPTSGTADAAKELGIPVIRDFFGESFARKLIKDHPKADLVIGNNVYAHIPDINDFTSGIKTVLNKKGTVTLEFQHLLTLFQLNQFDTVYHEHYSYLSLHIVSKIFEKHGLQVYDVEKINTHGGSLRIYGCHAGENRKAGDELLRVLDEEDEAGMNNLEFYATLQPRTNQVKYDLLVFLIEQFRKEKTVVAYGAAAKANTLFNYAGVKPDLIPFICDAAKSKQGKFLPGSHIPIVPVSELIKQKPDYILIVPWNIKEEIMEQLKFVKEWGATFVISMPDLHIVESENIGQENNIISQDVTFKPLDG